MLISKCLNGNFQTTEIIGICAPKVISFTDESSSQPKPERTQDDEVISITDESSQPRPERTGDRFVSNPPSDEHIHAGEVNKK